jgi:predicted MFS family arabinose efflux permease
VLRPDPLEQAPPAQQRAAGGNTLAFLRLSTVWMCFAFLFLTSVALGGIQAFATIGLEQLYGISRELATGSYTGYMLASACGMVVGGFVSTAMQNYDRTIAIAFTLAAAMALLLGTAVVPGWMTLPLMALIGFFSGVAAPSRDLMIRAVAPKGAIGRVYGVVYSGLDSGLALGPLLFGVLMDAGHPGWLFIGIALLQLLAIGTAVDARGSKRGAQITSA